MVSPLVALMRDQLNHLPPQIPAAMLWRGQTKAEAMQILADLAVSVAAQNVSACQTQGQRLLSELSSGYGSSKHCVIQLYELFIVYSMFDDK